MRHEIVIVIMIVIFVEHIKMSIVLLRLLSGTQTRWLIGVVIMTNLAGISAACTDHLGSPTAPEPIKRELYHLAVLQYLTWSG